MVSKIIQKEILFIYKINNNNKINLKIVFRMKMSQYKNYSKTYKKYQQIL